MIYLKYIINSGNVGLILVTWLQKVIFTNWYPTFTNLVHVTYFTMQDGCLLVSSCFLVFLDD